MSRKRHVRIVFTGGTICMRIDPATGAAVPALSGEDILHHVPGIKKEARLAVDDYARLPGPHVTPSWMWGLKEHAATVLDDPLTDAVVVAHGTDTLEETAFLLHLTLGSSKPVVFCGAMRTVSEPGWDGPANLMAAVRTAVHPDSEGRGVLIVLDEKIHTAAEATKWHTHHLAAFRSPHGPLGILERGRVLYHRPAAPRRLLQPRRLVSQVDLHTMAAGVDGGLIRASLHRGARGLVLEATGCGNVPPAILPALREVLKANRPVVLVSRCAEGRVSPAYGYEGGGLRLREMGVIFGGELPGPKARIKLMVALGLTSQVSEIRRLFEDTSR